MTASPIAAVDAVVLRAPTLGPGDLDGSSETVVVIVTDTAGRTGIGEADAPAEVVRQLVLMDDVHAWSRGLASILVGRDPFELGALHTDLYEGTIYHARRGLGIHAISAVDVALHDLVGKQLDRPVYQLLGGARHDAVRPYATIYAGYAVDRTVRAELDDLLARCAKALELGFRAIKVEALFGARASDRQLVECVRECRAAIGVETTLMLDLGYRWRDWREALWTLRRLEDCDVYFAEAALRHDDLDGHRRLAARVETRVCGAEFAATVHECREWLERGRVDVLQPDLSRSGGLSELRRIAELADLHGALVIPHGWKTGITAAAGRHFQAATVNAPFVEMFHPALFDSPLRAELVRPEPEITDGVIALPTQPGLGVELDPRAVERHRV